jgi:hypothetical protein
MAASERRGTEKKRSLQKRVHHAGISDIELMGQDIGLDQGFIADYMLRVGFKSVRSRTLDTPIGPMDFDIGRK